MRRPSLRAKELKEGLARLSDAGEVRLSEVGEIRRSDASEVRLSGVSSVRSSDRMSGKIQSSEASEVRLSDKGSGHVSDALLDKSTVLVVICYERFEALRTCLASVVRYHPCGSAVLVSQDGLASNNEAVEDEVRKASQQLHERCGEELVTFIRHDAQTTSGSGYHKLARHFKFALSTAFEQPHVRRAIVLEEDLVIAADFFNFFAAVAPILDADRTLLAASAWNDNGQEGRVNDPKRVVRSDFFPGLGWMLTMDMWHELQPKWPGGYWDDWLREPLQRKGRHILRPEICRTFHQVSAKGGTSNNQYGSFLRNIKLHQGEPIDFYAKRQQLADELALATYDAEFGRALQAAQLLHSVEELAHAQPGSTVRLEYSGLEDGPAASFPALARRLGIMDNIKAGVPRAAYRGVVDFWHQGVHILLSPDIAQVEVHLQRLD